jgi:class 3 adenylate cyclase
MVFASPSARGSTFHTSHRTAPINHLADTHWELYAELISLIRWGWQDIDYARRFRDRLLTGWTNETWKKLWEAVDQLEAFDHAGMVTCPCLVILGSLESDPDRAQVARRLAADLPQGRLETNRGFSFDSLGTFKMALAFLSAADLSKAPKRFAASPAAFRTILFTDLEAHTAMMHRLGDAKGREVLREHERISREALRAHGGTEVKTIGDSFMASFPSAQKAVECAIALQRAFEASECAGERLRVRVGINAGEPIAEEDDLFGSSVILASRTKEKAAGGEIFVTDVVRQLVSGKGFAFTDRGEMEMKGFEEPVRLYEVTWQEAGDDRISG